MSAVKKTRVMDSVILKCSSITIGPNILGVLSFWAIYIQQNKNEKKIEVWKWAFLKTFSSPSSAPPFASKTNLWFSYERRRKLFGIFCHKLLAEAANIIIHFHKKMLEMLLGHFKSAIIFSKTNASIEMHSTGEVQFIARLICPLAKFLTQRNKRLCFQSMRTGKHMSHFFDTARRFCHISAHNTKLIGSPWNKRCISYKISYESLILPPCDS